MQIESIFKDFCDNLKERKGIMTEDNIRYYWFASMLKHDNSLNHYTLEYPYKKANCDKLQNEELDMLYKSDDETWCFEMKFHRKGESESQLPYTIAAGSLINDLMRLQYLKRQNGESKKTNFVNARYFFLYVTDCKMADYLGYKPNNGERNNPYRNELRAFFTGTCHSLSFPSSDDLRAFEGSAKKSLGEVPKLSIDSLRLLYKNDMECQSPSFFGEKDEPKPCYVRLYEIF